MIKWFKKQLENRTANPTQPLKPLIDYHQLPIDTLIEIKFKNEAYLRYFSHAEHTTLYCFINGKSSKTLAFTEMNALGIMSYPKIEVVCNDAQPWFGGECPVPDGLRIQYWTFRDHLVGLHTTTPSNLLWSRLDTPKGSDIIAYQIMGEA